MEPIIVNAHHHATAVRNFLAKTPWRDRVILVYEKELLGTGGTLLSLRERFGEGSFFVAHADNLSQFSVEGFVSAHRNRPDNSIITMMLFRTPTPETCGIVECDTLGRVIRFHEKVEDPPGNLANGAVYIMEPEIFSLLEEKGKERLDISLDLIPPCLGRIFTWTNEEYHRDIGTPESYRKALEEFPKGRE